MAFLPIARGSSDWDVPVNAAFTDQDARITEVESRTAGQQFYLLVASNSAPTEVKAKADYVCDGVADQVEIQAAVDAAFASDGCAVQLSAGPFLTTAPITLHPTVTLQGVHGDGIFNPDQLTATSYIAPQGSFIGGAAIVMLGQTAGGYADKSAEQRIFNLTILGDASAASVHGIQASDYIHGVVLRDVAVVRPTGKGIYTFTENSSQPFSWTMNRVVVDNAVGNGIELINHSDFTAYDVVCIGSGGSNWVLSNMPNSRLTNCRAEWSDAHGYRIEGNFGTGQGSGALIMVGCSTDRNSQNGLDITSTGNAPILISGLMTRRDGRNAGAGGGGYAAIFAANATTPLVINGWTQYPGVDDGGGGTNSPQVGGHFDGNTAVQVESSYIHAATTALNNTGTNTIFSLGTNIVQATGTTAAPSRSVPIILPTEWNPVDHAFETWSFDPSVIQGGAATTAGTIYMIKMPIRVATQISSLVATVTTAGSVLTANQNFAGLYSSTGVRLGQTVDQSTTWNSIGTKTMGISGGAVTVQPGFYYLALLSNGTTPPQFARSQVTSASAVNVNLTAATGRYITTATAQTTLPATIDMAALAATDSTSRWVAFI
jgi:hypothetical protein